MNQAPACPRCGGPIFAVVDVSALIVETGQRLRLAPGAAGTAYCARCVLEVANALKQTLGGRRETVEFGEMASNG